MSDDSKNLVNLPHIGNDQDFRRCIEECNQLLTTKGADYTQGALGDEGRLKNFYVNAARWDITVYKSLGQYMYKHLDAIQTFLLKGQVESEPIEGRIEDAINYLFLLFKLVQHEKRKAAAARVDPMAALLPEGR